MTFSLKYTYECVDLQHCLQQSVVAACKCRDISLPGQSRYPHLPFCTDDSHIPEHCRHEAAEDCFEVRIDLRPDLLAKNCLFFLPLSHSAPSLSMFPLEFCHEVKRDETRVMGLSSSEDPMIVAWVVLTQCQRVTDRRTDRRTDGRIYYS